MSSSIDLKFLLNDAETEDDSADDEPLTATSAFSTSADSKFSASADSSELGVPRLSVLDREMRLRGLDPVPPLPAPVQRGFVSVGRLPLTKSAHLPITSSSSSFANSSGSATGSGTGIGTGIGFGIGTGNALKRTSHEVGDGNKLRRISTPDDFSSSHSGRYLSRTTSSELSAELLPGDWPPPIAASNGDFGLLAQPKPKQRKSYTNENRYLAPNPITLHYVRADADDGRVTGTVTCLLADADGVPFSGDTAASLNGATQLPLLAYGRAEFQLKMLATNAGEYLRLRFEVDYERDGERLQCVVISDAFRVDTNVRRRASQRGGRRKNDSLSPSTELPIDLKTRSAHFSSQRAATHPSFELTSSGSRLPGGALLTAYRASPTIDDDDDDDSDDAVAALARMTMDHSATASTSTTGEQMF
jgi:hypothetical protein